MGNRFALICIFPYLQVETGRMYYRRAEELAIIMTPQTQEEGVVKCFTAINV
jgi:hypothetical protein